MAWSSAAAAPSCAFASSASLCAAAAAWRSDPTSCLQHSSPHRYQAAFHASRAAIGCTAGGRLLCSSIKCALLQLTCAQWRSAALPPNPLRGGPAALRPAPLPRAAASPAPRPRLTPACCRACPAAHPAAAAASLPCHELFWAATLACRCCRQQHRCCRCPGGELLESLQHL